MTLPGTLITLIATCTLPTGASTEAVSYLAVRSPMWRERPVYVCGGRGAELLAGMKRRVLRDVPVIINDGGVLRLEYRPEACDGVQLRDGRVLTEGGKLMEVGKWR